jgi:hypothetical protein
MRYSFTDVHQLRSFAMKKQAEEQERKELRHGYTTGACAAAATKAALLSLITGQAVHEVEIVLPVGRNCGKGRQNAA